LTVLYGEVFAALLPTLGRGKVIIMMLQLGKWAQDGVWEKTFTAILLKEASNIVV
jgi:hypothetical protein